MSRKHLALRELLACFFTSIYNVVTYRLKQNICEVQTVIFSWEASVIEISYTGYQQEWRPVYEAIAQKQIFICCCSATLCGRPIFHFCLNLTWQENDNKYKIIIKGYRLFWADEQTCQKEACNLVLMKGRTLEKLKMGL